MKTAYECVACLQNQVLRVARLLTDESEIQEQIMRECISHLAQVNWNTDPLTMTKGLYDIIHGITGIADPYETIKVRSNEEVLQFYPELQEMVQKSDSPLLTACKLAVAGNIMDFGVKDHFNIKETVQHVLNTDFTLNDFPLFQEKLSNASSLLWLADNAGEIVFDKLLLKTILRDYPVPKITIVVKAGPIINDATITDMEQIGMTAIPGVEFRPFGPLDAFDEVHRTIWPVAEVKQWVNEYDIVLSKGQANYEMFDEIPGIFFLLIAKCDLIGKLTETHKGALLFKFSA